MIVATRLQWADISPYRAVLYLISDDDPYNKKVAAVDYNHNDGKFYALVYDMVTFKARDVDTDIPSKVEAMESAMAMLVASRFDRAN